MTYLATQFYLDADAPQDEIQKAAEEAMANYETLNTGDRPLQPAGVYVGTDWRPAGEAARP